MRICLESIHRRPQGFVEKNLNELSQCPQIRWRSVLRNVEAQVELSMTLIQIRKLWPVSSRKTIKASGRARRAAIEGGSWQRVVKHAEIHLK
mgnify:CR=1 FL=1